MTIAPISKPIAGAKPDFLTYEEYMAEEPENRRYEIIDGVRTYMNPTRLHQITLRRIARPMEDYEEATGIGRAIIAPCDILIRRTPRLRTRQPDILFISRERWALNPPQDVPSPLDPAPELVVEIVSPSDTPGVLRRKIADYRSVDVRECWIARHAVQTVEVQRLTRDNAETAATYRMGETVESFTFSGLSVAVAAIFAGV